MTRYGTLLIIVILFLYGAFKLTPLLAGPELTLTSPANLSSVQGHTVILSGVASHTEKLTLNGALLPIDAEGSFQKTMTLPTGGAILSFTATDRFGKQVTIEREIYVVD